MSTAALTKCQRCGCARAHLKTPGMSWHTLLDVWFRSNRRRVISDESTRRTFCLYFDEPEEYEAIFLEGELSGSVKISSDVVVNSAKDTCQYDTKE